MAKGQTGEVIDIGGGEVHILVDRDVEAYPEIGTGVCVVSQIELQETLSSLSFAENGGDISDVVLRLCEIAGLPEPTWDSRGMRFRLEWEDDDV